MPLPGVADGNPFAFELLDQAEQSSAPANDFMQSDLGALVYPEPSVDVQPDVMGTDGVDPDMDLSMVASGGELTVVRGVTRPRTPTLQEPLRDHAKSTTCARQLTVAEARRNGCCARPPSWSLFVRTQELQPVPRRRMQPELQVQPWGSLQRTSRGSVNWSRW